MENSQNQKAEQLFFSYTKPANAKKTSITVSISILFLSIPVLYLSILRIPPSNLAKDTAFWFILSNSIILLVAADSGLFSSSSGKSIVPDACREFTRDTVPTFVAEPPAVVPKQSKGRVKQESSVQSSSQAPTTVEVSVNKAEEVRATEMEVKTVLPEPSSGDESSEYSRMSDEELRSRIEEFIRSFNREIKLQQTSGFQGK